MQNLWQSLLLHCTATWNPNSLRFAFSTIHFISCSKLTDSHWIKSSSQLQQHSLLQGNKMAPTCLLANSSFTGSKLRIPFTVQTRVSGAGSSPGVITCQQNGKEQTMKMSRRETILRSSGSALLLAFLNFAGERPEYLGVQSNPPSLALCPPTPTCISTSEELNDPTHYVPPWTYNPKDGRGRKNPAPKEKAMAELIDAIKTTKPDNFTPKIVKQTDDYVYVEYSSPLIGFVDDVEFWFPPGDRSLVEYRSASRREGIDFGFNRKRIKALRQALERYGWESIGF